MGWFDRNNRQNEASEHNGHDRHYGGDKQAEKRAADILRRLNAGHGSDSEVVDDFMRRVDERAEEMKRDNGGNGKKGWW